MIFLLFLASKKKDEHCPTESKIAQQLSFPSHTPHPTPHVKQEGVVTVLLPQEKEYLLASHSPFGSHLVGNFSLWFYFRFPESKIGSKVDSNMFHIAHGMARERGLTEIDQQSNIQSLELYQAKIKQPGLSVQISIQTHFPCNCTTFFKVKGDGVRKCEVFLVNFTFKWKCQTESKSLTMLGFDISTKAPSKQLL